MRSKLLRGQGRRGRAKAQEVARGKDQAEAKASEFIFLVIDVKNQYPPPLGPGAAKMKSK